MITASHTLGTVTRDADGDLVAICSCGQRDCAQPWSLAPEQVSR